MDGKLVSASESEIVVSHDSGPDTTHVVKSNVAVTLNGQKSSLADLNPGDSLSYHGSPVTSIGATR